MSRRAPTDAQIKDQHRAQFARMLSDPDTVIVCFENRDLTSRGAGDRVSFPYTTEVAAQIVLGHSQAPDHPNYGLGWRYLAVAKSTTVDEALEQQWRNQ